MSPVIIALLIVWIVYPPLGAILSLILGVLLVNRR